MDCLNKHQGACFSKIIEEDEEVPCDNLTLLSGNLAIYKGIIGDIIWICVSRIKGG